MKRFFLFLIPVVLAVIVFVSLLLFLSHKTSGKGALQVTTIPQSNVYLNGKLLGKTPLCKCEPQDMLATGEYTIKVVPVDGSQEAYEDKITINPLVLTVVDRTFADPGKSSGSIIYLTPINNKKNAQLEITSTPSDAQVSLDGNTVGNTTHTEDTITESDHEIIISKPGYRSKTVRIHGVAGYMLHVLVYLATDLSTIQTTPIVGSTTPQATVSATPSPISGSQVVILSTPTGFLRVRDSAGLSGNEIAQVHPGETYAFISEQSGWYQITLSAGKTGWISSSYAKKQ